MEAMASVLFLLLVCVGLARVNALNLQLSQDKSAGDISVTPDPPAGEQQVLPERALYQTLGTEGFKYFTNSPDTTPVPRSNEINAAAVACLLGYKRVAGLGCYKIGTHSMQYGYARAECELDDSHLAIPDSQEELDALQGLRAQYHLSEFWVGIHRINDSWQSLEGAPLADIGFPVWAPGYPFTTVNCTYLKEDGLANYYPCDNQLAFICEQPTSLAPIA